MVISIDAYERSSTYKFIEEVKEVTAPLKTIGVGYFIYAELKDYRINCLVDNDKMIRDFINYNGLKYELALSPNQIINSGLHSISNITKPKEFEDYYELIFDANNIVDQIIYIVDSHDRRKIYIFGVLDPFSISKEYLELFTLYFEDRAYALINKATNFEIPLEFIEYKVRLNIMIKSFIISKIQEEFLAKINAKYYKIKYLEQKYLLTPRETQCLELILDNKVAKEIANFLDLTTRTVETYIDNLRKKLNCRNKQEIIVKFFINSFL